MAFTLNQLEALERALAQGANRVRYTDGDHTEEVEFRSKQELEDLIARGRRELGITNARGIKRVAQRFNSGLG